MQGSPDHTGILPNHLNLDEQQECAAATQTAFIQETQKSGEFTFRSLTG